MGFYGKQSSLKTKLLLHSPVWPGIWTELEQQLDGEEQKEGGREAVGRFCDFSFFFFFLSLK